MAVEDHIDAVDDDQRHHDPGGAAQQRVGLHDFLFPLRLGVALEAQQQDEHGGGSGVEDVGFAQGVEGAVVEDHACHHVHRSGLLHAFFHIPLHDLIVGRGVGTSEGG